MDAGNGWIQEEDKLSQIVRPLRRQKPADNWTQEKTKEKKWMSSFFGLTATSEIHSSAELTQLPPSVSLWLQCMMGCLFELQSMLGDWQELRCLSKQWWWRGEATAEARGLSRRTTTSWTGTTMSVPMVRQRSAAWCSGRHKSPIRARIEKLEFRPFPLITSGTLWCRVCNTLLWFHNTMTTHWR